MELYKIAFLCSRKCPAEVVLKSLDWAKNKKDNIDCVISSFHSKIEKEVFDILLKGDQPLILFLARGMKKRWSTAIKNAVNEQRLLIISPFNKKVRRITQETANKRNKIMIDIADEVFIAYARKNGNLEKILKTKKSKIIRRF